MNVKATYVTGDVISYNSISEQYDIIIGVVVMATAVGGCGS